MSWLLPWRTTHPSRSSRVATLFRFVSNARLGNGVISNSCANIWTFLALVNLEPPHSRDERQGRETLDHIRGVFLALNV